MCVSVCVCVCVCVCMYVCIGGLRIPAQMTEIDIQETI
jgi:hypothetical protein